MTSKLMKPWGIYLQIPAGFPVQGGITVRDSSTVAPFGADNQYLEVEGREEGGNGFAFPRNESPSGKKLITVSFDLYWDSANTDSYMRWTLRGDNATNNLRPLHRIDIGGGANDITIVESGATGPQINEDTVHRFDIVFNFDDSATSEYNGANTVAANAMDLWIDGELIFDDEGFDRGNTEVNTVIADVGFWAQKGSDTHLGNFYFDNYQVDDTAVVTFDSESKNRPLEFTNIEVDDAAGEVRLTWASVEGAIYSVDRANSLSGNWLEQDDEVTGTAGTTTWSDTQVLELNQSPWFYRVRLLSPLEP